MKLTIDEIITATGGTLLSGDPQSVITRISTDTRTLKAGDLYCALVGPHFDGHQFVEDAIKKGAKGILVSDCRDGSRPVSTAMTIQVPDTLKALGDMAHAWRKKFTKPVIAITGSSGKTSTKELLSLCLESHFKVHKTEGNLNNLVGVPLTLFRLEEECDVAIIEMGMNAFGEIARLTKIASPTMGLITNVGAAHLEGVGSLEGVARAKGELFLSLSPLAHALVNVDDPFIKAMPTRAKKLTYGFSPSADIWAEKVSYRTHDAEVCVKTPLGKWNLTLPVTGEHHVSNLLACVAVCSLLKLSESQVQKGISGFSLGEKRGAETQLKNGIVLVNDCYNANPSSIQAALKALFLKYPTQRKIAVLGEMLELGAQSSSLHQKTGDAARHLGISVLLALGDHAKDLAKGFDPLRSLASGTRLAGSKPSALGGESSRACPGVHTVDESQAYVFDNVESLNQKLHTLLVPGDVVLVKGSRGIRMERVVDYLKERMG